VQPQAESQRDNEIDGVIESQTENVHEMVDIGRNHDVSELDENSATDDAATVSVERVSNEKSEMSNSVEMCSLLMLILG